MPTGGQPSYSGNSERQPFSAANTEYVGGSSSWADRIASTVATSTTEPLLIGPSSVEPEQIDVPQSSTMTTQPTPLPSILSSSKGLPLDSRKTSDFHGNEGIQQPESPIPSTDIEEPGILGLTTSLDGTKISPTSHSFIETALPMFKNMTQSATADLSSSAPNPLASSLARDTALVFARRSFHAPPIPDSIDAPLRASEIVKFYRTHLVPLLENLRSLHPRHIPCLLLLGCVYHAIGDFAKSLAVNDEILAIDANFVSGLPYSHPTLKRSHFLLHAIRSRLCPIRGRH